MVNVCFILQLALLVYLINNRKSLSLLAGFSPSITIIKKTSFNASHAIQLGSGAFVSFTRCAPQVPFPNWSCLAYPPQTLCSRGNTVGRCHERGGRDHR